MALRNRLIALGAFASLVAACSGDDSTAPQTGGAGGSTPADSSADGRGGTAGTGGAGGTTTSDARVETGPSGGSAGAPIVDDGAVASDGDGATGCPTAQYTHVSTFSAVFDGWTVSNNSSFQLVPGVNLEAEAAVGTLLELDTTDGSPVNGSAKLTIPFDGPAEHVDLAKLFGTGVNLTGTTVTAQVKLNSGLNVGPVNTGNAFLVLKSGLGYTYAAGTAIDLDPSAGWVTVSINADAPSPTPIFGYTACDIREIDLLISTGAAGTYQTAVVHIDTIAITAPGGEAGTDSDAASDAASDAVPEARPASPDAAEASLPDARDAGAEVGPDATE